MGLSSVRLFLRSGCYIVYKSFRGVYIESQEIYISRVKFIDSLFKSIICLCVRSMTRPVVQLTPGSWSARCEETYGILYRDIDCLGGMERLHSSCLGL